jgi:two-component system chemotaxis response regulator CheB
MIQTPPQSPSPIRVLVIDDSTMIRKLLTRELARDPEISVVGAAADPYEAREKIAALKPHVLTLDIEMPRMDGITFLRNLMRHYPLPVIVVSSITEPGTRCAIEAMACGAVDVVAKPGSAYSVDSLSDVLISRIKLAARTRVQNVQSLPQSPALSFGRIDTTDKLIAIGASTGGVQALTSVLTQFPPNSPATLVVQHMPPKFTKSFADRLSTLCKVQVREAVDNDRALPGTVLLAPGGSHMVLRRSGAQLLVHITDGPPICHQKPSVDVLFDSVAKYSGVNAMAALLTGMGNDGARGLLAIRNAGGRTAAQNEATCVVFGMPMEAIRLNAAEKILPLDKIPHQLLSWTQSIVPQTSH